MIQIYKKDTTKFEKNGDMTLFPTKCKLSAKLNGSWALDMVHPLDSMGRWKQIEEEAIIAAPTFMGKKQLFRIDELEKTDEEITVTAYPIFFDSADDCFLLDRRPEVKNGQQALDIMTEGTKYRGESNIHSSSTAYFVRRNLMDCINGEDSPTFVQRWGGEILYDNYKVIINERAGGDYGTEILYSKNMDGISYKLDLSETITRILPVAYNGHTLTGDEPWVDSPLIGKYAKVYAKEMKFDDVKLLEDANEDDAENGFIVCATKEELYAALVKKCEEQFNLGVDLPKVTIDVNMVDLSNTEEYKEFEELEKVGLGDTVHCKHRILNITTDARCIDLTWDCIRNVAEEMTLGEFEYDYFTEFSSTLQEVEKILGPNSTVKAERIQGVLNAINTQLRYQKNAAQRQDVRAILFEDLNKDSPMYGAMCLGTQGFQISNKRTADGRDWEWSTAFTAHGGYADVLISGILSDKEGKSYWDLDTGQLSLTGIFQQVNHNGFKSIDIYGNEVRFFDWTTNGNYVGSIGSVKRKNDGRVGINMWCDHGDMLWLGFNNGTSQEDNIQTAVSIDSKEPNEPPWIANTSTGNFLAGGVSVEVKNGLITSIPAHSTASGTLSVISGVAWDYTVNGGHFKLTRIDRLYITVEKGVITNWEEKSKYY